MPATAPTKVTPANRPGRIINYAELNKGYVARGRLDTWVDVAVFAKPERVQGQTGRPVEYSDGLIQMLLLLKIRFNLPYRALEGFASSLFEMMTRENGQTDRAVPSFGTIAERVRALGQNGALVRQIRQYAMEADSGTDKCLLVDSTGVSITGPGAWRATRPWTSPAEKNRRQFVKLHIAFNPKTGMIEGCLVTPSTVADCAVLPELVRQVGPETVKGVAADGAYHTKSILKFLVGHGIRDIRIPPKINGVPWSGAGSSIHNEAVHDLWTIGLSGYKKKVNYHVRSLVESTMFQLHSLTGSKARNRSESGIQAEVLAACLVLNKQATLGRAVYNKRAWTS